MKRAFQIVGFVLCASAAVVPGASADWPQWRGPNRDGVSAEKGLLKAWPAGGPRLLWKTVGIGSGFGSVSVLGNRLYTTGEGADQSRVLALNVADGKIVWTSSPLGKKGGDPVGPQASPALDGDAVYAMSQFGDVVCFDAATGKERWRKSLVRDFGGSVPGWNYSESPLLDGDRIVCTPGGARGAIVALNKRTGQVLWQSKGFKDEAHHSSLISVSIDSVPQYIQLTAQSVAGVDAKTGALLWRANRPGETAVVPTPIYADRCVYVTSGYNAGCNLFEIRQSGNAFSARQVYAKPQISNHHGGVIKVGDYIYGHCNSGNWMCQEFRTGRIVWKNRGVGKGSVAYADGHLYCRSEGSKGTVALVAATPDGYVEKGRFDQPDRSGENSWAHPVVAGGRLYLRDQDILLCYDVSDPNAAR
ncbi:MAG TPA: PQQ-like beta-propeller repeat protein [Candidatus Paceibacterota bacterium]|nr:PQQ-like beta-propeller repeat protein [Verrucomicrobiota bacterium]HOX02091.1 PQQ-like beta-propeller repeat protein [Verrucomicrobiota bacterium]HRZ45285.1 PQQ-like beta-propeller repeat protein [Candidatus Paceibacterota bacterium]HRZ91547.1 PQQ-like beta-propeller repeat protein [Candidatus Paceibacterota bacterium]